MLMWQNLSKAQQRWVTLVEMFYPEVEDTVTFQQIHEFHEFFKSKRTEDPKYKVGLALWMITHNAISRGVYFFPSQKNSLDIEPDEPVEVDPELEPLYQQELMNYGIEGRSVPAQEAR